MLKYKGYSVEEIISMGNVVLIDGMINSVNSKKSRNRNSKEVVEECDKVLDMLKGWKEDNGFIKVGKRGKYEGINIKEMSEEEISGYYESLYSRRWYYEKVGNKKKLEEVEGMIEEVKKVKLQRKREEAVK